MRVRIVFLLILVLFSYYSKAQLGLNYYTKQENHFLNINETNNTTPSINSNEICSNKNSDPWLRIGVSPVIFREIVNPIDKIIHYGIGANIWLNSEETYVFALNATYIFPITDVLPNGNITTSNILIGLNYIKFIDNTLDDEFSPYALCGMVYNRAYQSTLYNAKTTINDKNFIMFEVGIGAHIKVDKILLIFEGKYNMLLTDIPVKDMFSVGPSFFCLKAGVMIPIRN